MLTLNRICITLHFSCQARRWSTNISQMFTLGSAAFVLNIYYARHWGRCWSTMFILIKNLVLHMTLNESELASGFLQASTGDRGLPPHTYSQRCPSLSLRPLFTPRSMKKQVISNDCHCSQNILQITRVLKHWRT